MAVALKSLLDDVFPTARKAFISEHIDPGVHWSKRLGAELEKSQFGILCLTVDNYQAPWLLFEAGALAKKFAASRVVPYLIDTLPPAAENSPILQFQSIHANREGTFRLIDSINRIREYPSSTNSLVELFDQWWGDMDHALKSVRQRAAKSM